MNLKANLIYLSKSKHKMTFFFYGIPQWAKHLIWVSQETAIHLG